MKITTKTKEIIENLNNIGKSFNECRYLTMMTYHYRLNQIKEELIELGLFDLIDNLVLEIPVAHKSKYYYAKIEIKKNDNNFKNEFVSKFKFNML